MSDKWTEEDVLEHARELRSPFETPEPPAVQRVRDILRGGMNRGNKPPIQPMIKPKTGV